MGSSTDTRSAPQARDSPPQRRRRRRRRHPRLAVEADTTDTDIRGNIIIRALQTTQCVVFVTIMILGLVFSPFSDTITTSYSSIGRARIYNNSDFSGFDILKNDIIDSLNLNNLNIRPAGGQQILTVVWSDSPQQKKKPKLSNDNSQGSSTDTNNNDSASPDTSVNVNSNTCPSLDVDIFDDGKEETTKRGEHCRERYPNPPTNPQLPDDYKPQTSLGYNEDMTTLFSGDTDVTRALFDSLPNKFPQMIAKYDKFGPHVPELDRHFKTDRFEMQASNLEGNYITCDDNFKKNGRSTLLRTAKLLRYPNTMCTRIISNRGKYPPKLNDEHEDYIKGELYEIIKPNDDEDLDTYQGKMKYQERTALNPYFAGFIKNIKDYGCGKRGVCKALVLNLEEIAYYKAFKKMGTPQLTTVNPMEMLHGNQMYYWKKGIDGINYNGPIMITTMTSLMFNTNPQSYVWVPNTHIGSWAPEIGSFTKVDLQGEVTTTDASSAKRRNQLKALHNIVSSNIEDSTAMAEEVMDEFGVDFNIGITSNSVAAVVAQVRAELDRLTLAATASDGSSGGSISTNTANDRVLILVVTEYIYYCIDGGKKKATYVKNFIDPLGTVEKGWDTSTISDTVKRVAVETTSLHVDEHMKGFRTGLEDDRFISYMLMDTQSVAFGDLEGAETLIRGKGFRSLGVMTVEEDHAVLETATQDDDEHSVASQASSAQDELVAKMAAERGFELGVMKVFWYWNDDICQFIYIFLHRPLSRAFNNRPPWDPWKMGDDEIVLWIDTSFTIDYTISTENYIHGRTNTIIADETSSSFQSATHNKNYLSTHVHLDTQLATLHQKHDVSRGDKLNIEPLDSTSGFEIKHRNAYERSISRSRSTKRRNYSIGDDMRNFVYYSVKAAADKILIVDLNNKRRAHLDILKRLKRIQEENFHNEDPKFEVLREYIIQEHKEWLERPKPPRQWQLTEERAIQLEKTYQRHKSVLIELAQDMNNWYDVDDEYVLLFPSSRGGTYDTYGYLQRLKDRELDGDEDRRADLVALGWSFDDLVRTEATLMNMGDNLPSSNGQAVEQSSLDGEEMQAAVTALKGKSGFGGGAVDLDDALAYL